MGFFTRLTTKIGLTKSHGERHPMRVFLLEDDERRCDWFSKRFKGNHLDIVCDVAEAKELLKTRSYDAVFLDHDLRPEHYGSTINDDERTGFAIAHFLASHPQLQRAAFIMVHSYNPDGAIRMVEELRGAGRQAEYVPFNYLDDRIKSLWPR